MTGCLLRWRTTNFASELGRKYNQMGVTKKKISRSLVFYMPQSGVECRAENIFTRFIEIFVQCFYVMCGEMI